MGVAGVRSPHVKRRERGELQRIFEEPPSPRESDSRRGAFGDRRPLHKCGTEQGRVVGIQGSQIYSVGRGSGSRLENFRHRKFLVPYVNHQLHLGERQTTMKRLLVTAAVLAAPTATRSAGTRLRARQRDLLLLRLRRGTTSPRNCAPRSNSKPPPKPSGLTFPRPAVLPNRPASPAALSSSAGPSRRVSCAPHLPYLGRS